MNVSGGDKQKASSNTEVEQFCDKQQQPRAYLYSIYIQSLQKVRTQLL